MVAPLDGIRIIDWTQWQMGPVSTAMMVDLGAEVIKVEDRITGDAGRGLIRVGASTIDLPQGRRAYFETNNRGKKGITVDLKKPKGKEIIYRLVKKSDVFVHNFRQGVPERLELDYETLCQYNPNLIYVAASSYGPKGPEGREPGFDRVGQARSGIMTQLGGPGSPPQLVGGAIADQMGGIITAYGILAALVARERLGVAQKVDTSHLGGMMTLLGGAISRTLYLGAETAQSARAFRTKAPNPISNFYLCQDGRWLMLHMLQSDRYWPTVCRALSIQHLEKDPKFENHERRTDNCEELVAIMDEVFLTKSVTEWLKILREAGDTICTPVQTIAELANDPQVLANEYIVECHHEVLGPVKVLGLPIQLSKTPGVVKAGAPEWGQHTEEVLIEVGDYTWEEIAQLRDEEII